MIASLVEFDLPPGTTRDTALALYRISAEGWAANRELIEKIYLYDRETGRGGGLYLWPSPEVAHRHLGDAYVAMVRERYGAPPTIRLLDAVLRVEPGAGRITALWSNVGFCRLAPIQKSRAKTNI